MIKRVVIDTLRSTVLVATTKADGKARSMCNSEVTDSVKDGIQNVNSFSRDSRGPQMVAGNNLQVADFFPFSGDGHLIHLNLTFLKH